MPRPVEPVPVELGQLRELLTVDRLSAGEARQAQSFAPLNTIAYSMPWRVRVRRRWRSDRPLRIKCWGGGLLAIALLLCMQVPSWSSLPVLAVVEPRLAVVEPSTPRAGTRPGPGAGTGPGAGSRIAPVARELSGTGTTPQVAAADDAMGEPVDSGSGSEPGLSARRRLQRADLWLRVGSERGAREARALLHSALAELPDSAHGQAALAEACMQLRDAGCARAAIDRAKQLRPWRAGYRVLSRRIDETFLTP